MYSRTGQFHCAFRPAALSRLPERDMAGMGNPRPAEAAGTDIFDSALHLEEQHIHEGYQDGLQ